jgi:hypothetical protein
MDRNKKGQFVKGHSVRREPLSKEAKARISKKMKGRKLSGEQKKKISLALKGSIPWNKGKKGIYKKSTLAKMRKAKLGKKRLRFQGKDSWHWKGDDISYSRLHAWVTEHKGRPKRCEDCDEVGKEIAQKNGKIIWSLHWSNISGKYKRKLNDWQGLCPKCHRKYDDRKKSSK